MKGDVDLLVIGSGAAGLAAALRGATGGLDVLVAEKAHRFGGTSALSGGGLWIPAHGLAEDGDTPDQALAYLRALCGDRVNPARLEAYVDQAPVMLRHLIEQGIGFEIFPGYPDYFPDREGARAGRAVFPAEIDGRELGEPFHMLRDQPPVFKLFNRYTVDLAQAFALSLRAKGWRRMVARIIAGYWLDLGTRRLTARDRRLTMGTALIGGLRKALDRHGVPIELGTALERLEVRDGRVTGAVLRRHGQRHLVQARRGVVLAAGGFEQNQALRDRYFPVPTDARWSLTPPGANSGDALVACEAVDADHDYMNCGWWTPTMQLPSTSEPNMVIAHQMFLDHRHPHSLCVNRLGRRFVDESCSYDLFGIAMVEDQKKTGANVPCWMIFDANYRAKYTCGGILPSTAVPDWRLPRHWIDTHLYRAESIAALAGKIDVDARALGESVAQMNEAARTGTDPLFGRGSTAYDRYFGDPRMPGNPCLGPIDKGPFYAVRVDLGDIGTKGGLKTDEHARVMSRAGAPIAGLYAAGNCAASPFGDVYPGAGGTLGPAMVFGHVAAAHAAGAS